MTRLASGSNWIGKRRTCTPISNPSGKLVRRAFQPHPAIAWCGRSRSGSAKHPQEPRVRERSNVIPVYERSRANPVLDRRTLLDGELSAVHVLARVLQI